MRAALIIALGLAAGCETRPCKDGTLLVTVDLNDGTDQADSLEVSVTAGTAAPITTPLSHAAGERSGTVQVDFPAGYPSGQTVRVDVVARQGAAILGQASGSTTASDGCSSLRLSLCGPGLQDNDIDGICKPNCVSAGLSCSPKSTCSDASGTATCVCAPGYALENDACVWQDVPKDPEFQDTPAGSWTVGSGAMIEPTAIGLDAPGNLHFFKYGICLGGASARQQITMPTFAESETFALQTVTQQDCIRGGYPCGTGGGVNLRINGGMHLFAPSPGLVKRAICLGERAYGGPVVIDVVPANNDHCDGNPETFDIRVDQTRIVPDATCPTPGTVPNGDFEGTGEWGADTSSGGAAGVVPGIGVGGSLGGELTTTAGACQSPSLTGRISAPFKLPNAALVFAFKGTQGKTATLGEGMSPWGTLVGTGAFGTSSLCVPEYAKGLVLPLRFATSNTSSFSCTTGDARDLVIDNFTFVSDPSCPAVNLISDGGFERNSNEWNISLNLNGTTSGVTGAIVTNTSQAHTGMRSLQASVSQKCVSATVSTVITVPDPVGNAGPALKYFYKAPVRNNMSISLSSDGGASDSPPAATVYTERTMCLDPGRAGQGTRLWVRLSGPSGTCADTFTTEVVNFDDFVVTTDPNCPTK